MTEPTCLCFRTACDEAWHGLPGVSLMEEVTITVPRYALERAAYLVDLNDGAWSSTYKALAPYLNQPKPDPSTPIPENPAPKKLA